MNKIYKIFALFIILLSMMLIKPAMAANDSSSSVSAAPDIVAIQKRGVLRLALYNQNINNSGANNSSSVEIDLASLIASQLGVKLVIEPASNYDEVINLIAENKADMGAELAILPDRALRVSFTNSYYNYHPHFLVNRFQSAKYGWNTPEEVLAGMKQGGKNITIGVLQDSASVNIVQANFPNAQVVSYADPAQSLQDVVSGKIYAAMGSTPIDIQNFLAKNPRAGLRAEQIDLSTATLLVAIAVPWQDFHLREWLNSYLNYLQQNGITNQIFSRYGYTLS